MKIIRLALMLCITSVIAQSNYVPGTITTLNNQVLQGEINYQDWKKTPETISFKSGANEITYKPEDLLSFQVEGDKYISKLVDLDVTQQQLNKMTDTEEVRFEKRHVFLNVLVQGNANLYEYFDYRTHFFAEKEGEFMELIYRKKLQKGNQDLMIFKKYLGQLNVMFNDCSSIRVSDNLDYRRIPLAKVFEKYNACAAGDDSQEVYTKELSREKGAFHITAGLAFSNFNLESPLRILENFDGGSFITPSFGLAYDTPISKNRNKWTLRAELLYSMFKGEFEPSELKTITEGKMFLEQNTLVVNALLRYKIKSKNDNLFPFINFGPGFSYVLSNDNTIDYKRNNATTDDTQTINIGSVESYFSLNVGAGVIFNRFTAEARFMITDKVLGSVHNKNSITNIGLMVGYQLF